MKEIRRNMKKIRKNMKEYEDIMKKYEENMKNMKEAAGLPQLLLPKQEPLNVLLYPFIESAHANDYILCGFVAHFNKNSYQ